MQIKDWEPYGGLWKQGDMVRIGDVTCTVTPQTDRGHEYYDGKVTYKDANHLFRDYERRFTYEADAKRWCIENALGLQGFIVETVLMFRENAATRQPKVPRRAGRSKKPKMREEKKPIKIVMGENKIVGELPERRIQQLVKLFKAK